MVLIFVKMRVSPAKRKELMMTLDSIIREVRHERGCQQISLYRDVETEDELLLLEEWSTRKELDAHLDSDIFTVLQGAGCLLVRPPEIVIHTADQPGAWSQVVQKNLKKIERGGERLCKHQ